MKAKLGFTLIELLIVLAIIAILVVVMTGNINPILMVARANDSRRKKDLGRLSVAFEEYYNDQGCYPSQAFIDSISTTSNCGEGVFRPWLNKWLCDPERRQPYVIVMENSDCPEWFKIYANLMDKNDQDIPDGWYELENFRFGYGQLTPDDVNYGVSSTNVTWHEMQLSENCGQGCFRRIGTNSCGVTAVCGGGFGGQCFTDSECSAECSVSSCNN